MPKYLEKINNNMIEKQPKNEKKESQEDEVSPELEKKTISQIQKNLEKMGSKEVDYNKPPK